MLDYIDRLMSDVPDSTKKEIYRKYMKDSVVDLDVLKWMHKKLDFEPYTLTIDSIEDMTRRGYTDSLIYVLKNQQLFLEESDIELIDYNDLSYTSLLFSNHEVSNWLLENGYTTPENFEPIDIDSLVTEKCDPECLAWIFKHYKDIICTTDAMDNSVHQFEVLKWLHANRTEGCTTKAMDNAALHGKLDIIKWLHENRTEGCTSKAMDCAASQNHLDIIKWLHENRTEGCTSKAMDKAAASGNLPIVEWLHINRSEGCTTNAMDSACKSGYLEVVKWLHHNRTEGCTIEAMTHAVIYNQLEVVKFLHKNRTEGCQPSTLDIAARNVNIDIMEWFKDNRTESYSPNILHETAISGYKRILSFILDNTTENLPDNTFDEMAKARDLLETMQLLHNNYPKRFKVSKLALDNAIGTNNIAVIKFLCENRTEGCSRGSIVKSIQNNGKTVLEWLIKYQIITVEDALREAKSLNNSYIYLFIDKLKNKHFK